MPTSCAGGAAFSSSAIVCLSAGKGEAKANKQRGRQKKICTCEQENLSVEEQTASAANLDEADLGVGWVEGMTGFISGSCQLQGGWGGRGLGGCTWESTS